MRSLTPTESRLLILFAGALFIMANLFGLKYGMRARAKLTRDTAALESRISEDRSWMILAEDFVEPRQWLAANPPPVFAADAASTELIRVVRGGTEAQGLTMTEESLLPAEGAAGYPNVNLQCKLSGAFPGFVHLLFELQKPGAWRSVEKLNVKSDATPPNVLVEMQIRQYFSDAQPSEPISQP